MIAEKIVSEWSDDQLKAIDDVVKFLLSKETFYSVIGPAGSGKTYLMKEIIGIAKKRKWNVLLTAPTHKAAEQLSRSCSESAVTTHKALGVKIKENNQTGEREFKSSGKAMVNYRDLVIIDEASMCAEKLLSEIEKVAKKKKCRVLFVGDRAQLNPVGEEISLTVDPIGMPWNFSELTTIHRQAAQNPIIAVATAIRTAEPDALPLIENNHTGTIGVCRLEKQQWAEKMLDVCVEDTESRYIGYTNFAVDSASKFIRFEKHGSDVCKKNPYLPGELMVVNERYQVGEGDDKITVENNTEFQIQRVFQDDGFYFVTGIIDGDLVEFRCFENYAARSRYLSDLAVKARETGSWKPFFKEANSIADLRLASSLTVHKSQGSTFANVFINLDQIARCGDLYERQRLLYVAITRASDTVYITGTL